MNRKKSTLRKAALMALTTLFSGGAMADQTSRSQVYYPLGDQSQFKGVKSLFTGKVSVEILFPTTEHSPYSGAKVSFSPGARTAWHQHPAGQHMVVTRGIAVTGTRDGQVQTFSQGETVWCPPAVDHWHGATPHMTMQHLVITGSKDDENVVWKEQVDEKDYSAAVSLPADVIDRSGLSQTQASLVRVSALVAMGDTESLAVAVHDALDAGISISALKESMIHLYAYTGFPRALNALGTLLREVESRKAAGKKDISGESPSAIPKNQDSQTIGEKVQTQLVGKPVKGPLFEFAPGINTYLQSHLFGDIFARGVLDYQQRELVTVAALASMEGTKSQLSAHMNIATNVGVTKAQLEGVAQILSVYIGEKQANHVSEAIRNRLVQSSEN